MSTKKNESQKNGNASREVQLDENAYEESNLLIEDELASFSESNHEENTAAIEELHSLLEKYNETVLELRHHYELHNHESKTHYQHLLHEIRAGLNHVQEMQAHAAESTEERKAEFFNHHAEALRHANEHWMHLQHHLETLFEELLDEETEELIEIEHRIKHTQKENANEKQEKKEA